MNKIINIYNPNERYNIVINTNTLDTTNIDTKVHGAHTLSRMLVLKTMNVSTTTICPVISVSYTLDMFAMTLPNALRIYPKRSEMIYLVMFFVNTDLI